MAETQPVTVIMARGVRTIPPKVLGKPGLQECASECTGPLYDYLPTSFTPAAIQEGHNPGKSKSQKKIEQAFHEVYSHPPSTLGTNQTTEERRAQMTAIALAKARAKGARIPRKGT